MVNVNALTPEEQSEEAAWGMLSGRSIRKFDKFADEVPVDSGNYIDRPVGTSYTGVVAELPKQYQALDYDSREPKFYKDGSPIMEISIVLDTQYRDPEDEDDDGTRIVRLGQNGKRALQDELRRLGIKRFGIGTQFTMTFTGYKPNASGKGKPSKLYEINLVPTEYVSALQLAVEQTLAQAGTVQPVTAAGGFPTQQQMPQQQYVQPGVPQQVVQQAPATQAAPAVDPAVLAAAQAMTQQQAPAGPAGIVILQEHVEQVNALVKMGIPRETAIQAVTNTVAGGDAAFRTALDNSVVI